MKKMSWSEFWDLFCWPLMFTVGLAFLTMAHLRFVAPKWPHLINIWYGLWGLSFLLFLSLMPMDPYRGGKISRAVLGRVAGGSLGFVFLIAFALATRTFVVPLLFAVMHGLFLFFISRHEWANYKINWKQKLVAVPSHIILIAVSFLLFVVASVQVGQLSVGFEKKTTMKRVPGDLVDVRGQVHVHCYLSHDSQGSLDEIAEAARNAGVRWVILTDHIDKLPSGHYSMMNKGVLFLYGSEGNCPDGGSEFLSSLKNSPEKLKLYGHAEQFHKWDQKDWQDWDGIEIVNFHANSLTSPIRFLKPMFYSPKNLYQPLAILLRNNFRYWQELSVKKDRPIPIFAGPDAHKNVGALGFSADSYDLLFRLVSTHIWLEAGELLNEQSLVRAIKKGRTYVAFDYLGDPSGFQFWARTNLGTSYTGDTVLDPVSLQATVPNPVDTEIRIFLNDVLVFDYFNVLNYTRMSPEPGFWRIEIYRNGMPWIVSGEILVK